MSATALVGHAACATCSVKLNRSGEVFHVGSSCPFDPSAACAACGAVWVEDRGSLMLEHAPGCAYVEAMAS